MAHHDASSHSDERANLTKRTIPSMTLANGSDLARSDGRHSTDRDTAQGRFAIVGNAIVTGGTGAIGMAVCRALLQHGLQGLMIFDLGVAASSDKIEALRREFPHAKVEARDVNVTDEEQVERTVGETAATLGSVDAMVCFAGIVHTEDALATSAATFRKILDVNTTGSFICATAAARQMVRQQQQQQQSGASSPSSAPGGRIVLTSSISAHRVNFPQPQVAYNVSKGALLMMKSSLAAEWARYGITVNSVSPGYMDTILNEGDGLIEHRRIWGERNPTGRMGKPEELTGVIVMLLSRAGSYINGADFGVDGGSTVF